jgi:hypothetical protein
MFLAFLGSFLLGGSSQAYTVNGMYFSLEKCSYQYNSDFNQGGYEGTYRARSGARYTWFFPSGQYGWCPY